MIERGPAKYFHGREQEIHDFQYLMLQTMDRQMGSSMLIQGPPGVGKTALIEELKKHALQKGWQVFKLSNECLFDPKELFTKLTKKTKPKAFQKSFGIDLKVFQMNIATASVSQTNALNEALVLSQPTLLYLDEAQTLHDFLDHPDRPRITSFLNTYHNLESKKGFVLLLGGLNHSQEVLQQLGISRWNTGTVRHLKRLEPTTESQIIDDWLMKEIKTKDDPTHWIQQISQKTDGWPRHLQSYCNAISQYVAKGGHLTNETLHQVIVYGDELKKKNYEERCFGLSRKTKQIITSVIQSLPEAFDIEDMMEAFSKTWSSEKAQDIYQKILSRGIIQMDQAGVSSVPVPSFRSFLIEHYGKDRSRELPNHGLSR